MARLVEDLLQGRRPRVLAQDSDDRHALLAAALLDAARQGLSRMSPKFRHDLAARLASAQAPALQELFLRSLLKRRLALRRGRVCSR